MTTAQETTPEASQADPAVGIPVHRRVRPVAWTLRAELDARQTTYRAHLWFSDPVNSSWAPLYDQAALDAAVDEATRRQNASWKLMCEKMVAVERERLIEALRREALNKWTVRSQEAFAWAQAALERA